MPIRQASGGKPQHTTRSDLRRFRGEQPIPPPINQRRRPQSQVIASDDASPPKDED